MRTGLKAMQQAVKNATSQKGGFRRFSYFNLEDGQSIFLRFITDLDDIITTKFYEYVQDNQGGQQSFIVAPDLYADDPSWQGEDWVLKYGGKAKEWGKNELSDPKAKERTVAIAVEREEVPVESQDGGRPKFKYQDKLITVQDKDGNEFLGRNFIIVRRDSKTFWGQLVGYAGEFDTLCDRDYKITRQGKQLATQYNSIPKGEDPDWKINGSSLKALQARYGYGTGADVDGNELSEDNSDRFLYCPMTLPEWAAEQASEEKARALLGTPREDAQVRHNGSGVEIKSGFSGNESDEAQAAPVVNAGAISDLRARLEGHV